jgi:hypothetical protein
MQAEATFTAAVEKAEQAFEQANVRAGPRRDAVLAAAAEKLSRAMADHDETVAAADRTAAVAALVATRDRDAAIAKAADTFDRQAPQEVGALAGAKVTGTPGSAWWLHIPPTRQPIASVNTSHGGTWRCHAPDGAVMFMPTEPQARAWLWKQAAADAAAVA